MRAAQIGGGLPLAVGVVWDEARREAANREQRNYWYCYIWELLDRLGIRASRIAPGQLRRRERLRRFSVIIAGDLPGCQVTPEIAEAFHDWVRRGGTLVGFAPEGLDDLFGVRALNPVAQAADGFAITGYLEFARSRLTEGIHSILEPRQRLITMSAVRPVAAGKCNESARFFKPHATARDDGARARDTGLAAVTTRRLGRGWAFYFGFDVAETVWRIQQGRPVDADHDGDGYLRFGDAIAIGKNSPRVAYADELGLLLQNMIARSPVPMVHQLPAKDGRAPEALFYFGGDDECQPGIQVPASDFMKSRGLPYHINLMPLKRRFAVGKKECRRIRANGHELSLHYNFMDGFRHPGPFTPKDVARQSALFYGTFGRRAIATVNHWCRWTGWAEPAKWMLAAGGKADNSRIHWGSPPLNPVNRMGFAFGTAFPYFLREDWRGGNARIPFLQQPIVAYEVGYQGERTDFGMIRKAVDTAARYSMTMNMFLHPVYIATNPNCRAAVDELLRYLGSRRIEAAFMGNDELWRWWWQRSKARIWDARFLNDALSFKARCAYKGGFVVKVPLGDRRPERCLVDGRAGKCRVERRFGQNWALVPLAAGRHSVLLEIPGRGADGLRGAK